MDMFRKITVWTDYSNPITDSLYATRLNRKKNKKKFDQSYNHLSIFVI